MKKRRREQRGEPFVTIVKRLKKGGCWDKKTERGWEAELKAGQAFQYFRERELEFPRGRALIDFKKTESFSREDVEGKTDFFLFFRKDNKDNQLEEVIRVAVQNWWTQERQDFFDAQAICLVAIWPKETGQRVLERVYASLCRFLNLKLEKTSAGLSSGRR
jgi:hypothetical protein